MPVVERTAFLRAAPAPDFWKLTPFYVSQQTSSDCSVASITMAINVLRRLPGDAEQPIITQTLLLNKVGDAGWASDVAEGGSGVTFAEFVSVVNESLAAFRLQGYLVDVVRPDDPGMLQRLRQALAANVASDQDVVLVYFDQGVLTGDWDGPHISPIAAYDQENGQVLIMDVDREWYVPYWTSDTKLLEAMRRPAPAEHGRPKARLAVLSGSSLGPRRNWSPIPRGSPTEAPDDVDLIIRPALEQDCRDIAHLFVAGSEGVAELVWRKECRPDETVIDVGARRCARTGVPFSYENCVVVERKGKVVGLLHAYPMESSSGPTVEAIEPVLRPFARLKDVGSFYLSALVVQPGYRRLGIGWRLLDEAHQRALRHGSPRLSVVVLEQNEAAMRLYRRAGFVEIDRTPLVAHPALPDWTEDAILLTKRTPTL